MINSACGRNFPAGVKESRPSSYMEIENHGLLWNKLSGLGEAGLAALMSFSLPVALAEHFDA